MKEETQFMRRASIDAPDVELPTRESLPALVHLEADAIETDSNRELFKDAMKASAI